jgi:hypothetical protein
MKKDFKVPDHVRTNHLSLEPGGSVVTIVHSDGKRLVYDKIKKPLSYINKAAGDDDVAEIWLDGEKVYPIETIPLI